MFGEIPGTLGNCIMLVSLYMHDNNFHGTIPSSLSALRSIEVLDLSSNELLGQVPKYFENFSWIQYLNLSFNDLEGEKGFSKMQVPFQCLEIRGFVTVFQN